MESPVGKFIVAVLESDPQPLEERPQGRFVVLVVVSIVQCYFVMLWNNVCCVIKFPA